jgi:hypothetical protein
MPPSRSPPSCSGFGDEHAEPFWDVLHISKKFSCTGYYAHPIEHRRDALSARLWP